MRSIRRCFVVLSSMGIFLSFAQSLEARIKLENICKLAGQREIHLRGIGLVTGLAGTGDGGKSVTAARAMQQMMKNANNPVADLKDLKNAKNFALVQIQATIPATGIRPGQKIDCYITSALGAKSLKGGRLMAAPLMEVGPNKEQVVGIASGSLHIEEIDVPTVGKISGGVVIKTIYPSQFIDSDKKTGVPIIRLLIDKNHASFFTATDIAQAINTELEYAKPRSAIPRGAGRSAISRDTEKWNKHTYAVPRGAGVVEVKIPKIFLDAPVEFVSEVLHVTILDPITQARVVINARTGTIIITGDVEISPVLITHPNLRIQIGTAAAAASLPSNGGFINLKDPAISQNSQDLDHLLNALNELQVPAKNIIEIIRELHRSGKLHAELIEN